MKITPTTTTGDPNVAEQLILLDLSTNAGGGSDSDDIPEGPVFDDAVKVVIHEQGVNTNLLGKETKLKTNTTYQVMLWKDKNSNGSYDTGEEVTSQYNYRWRFTGTSLQLRTNGGIVNPSYNNSDRYPSYQRRSENCVRLQRRWPHPWRGWCSGLRFVHRLPEKIIFTSTIPAREWSD